jgi:hypothetical protein
MCTARGALAAAPLPDGRVLVAGGSNTITQLSGAEAYNPATNSWTAVGAMNAAREGLVAAPLPDGRVLVAGGTGGSTNLSSAEIFNPATNTFSAASSMGIPRRGAVAAPLPGGRVLVAGGVNNSSGASAYLSSAEVYNPATNAWSGVGSMETVRYYAAAAPLPDGRVLVAGGFTGFSGLSSAEVFNPQTNTFSSAGIGPMDTARVDAAAAPLPDGRVLVAGGLTLGGSFLSSAEIFAATNAFTFVVKDRTLMVSVQASGTVSVSEASSPLDASASKKKKKKRKPLLKQSRGAGDPPTITVSLRLSKLAEQKLRRNGKVTVNARITFSPQGGLASTQTAKLKFKGKKQRGKK